MVDDNDDLTVVVLLPPPLLLQLFVDESIDDVVFCSCCSVVVDVVDLTVLPRLQGAAETAGAVVLAAVDLVALLADTSMLAIATWWSMRPWCRSHLQLSVLYSIGKRTSIGPRCPNGLRKR